MKTAPPLLEPDALSRLPYYLEWRPRLWAPPVRWLLGDPARFQGKSVLELGCRSGRMSCLFGLLGARVLGVDLPWMSLESARQEAERLGLAERVRFQNYSGDPDTLTEEPFDFIFTKSVLVVVPELAKFFGALARKLAAGGQVLAAENLAGGRLLKVVRRLLIHKKEFLETFRGVDDAFLTTFDGVFEILGQRRFLGLVTAIRACRR